MTSSKELHKQGHPWNGVNRSNHQGCKPTASWTTNVPGVKSAVPAIRHWIRAILHGSPHAEIAELLVSEFATNALDHTASGLGGRIDVTVEVGPDGDIYLDVTDDGPPPVPLCPSLDKLVNHGNGLDIVAVMATEWGQVPTLGGGRRTWAVLAADPEPAPT